MNMMIWLCDDCYTELFQGKDVECFTDGNSFNVYCAKCCTKEGTRHLHYQPKEHKHRWVLDCNDGEILAFCNEFMCDVTLTYSDIDEIINKEGQRK
jgi:hypothetical protein